MIMALRLGAHTGAVPKALSYRQPSAASRSRLRVTASGSPRQAGARPVRFSIRAPRATIGLMHIRAAIVGPTGYTALWLIRLLAQHPSASVTYLASHREPLPHIVEAFPELLGVCDLRCRPIDAPAIAAEADVAFCCLPHVSAMAYVPALLKAGLRVIDLSADYRLHDAALYERVYQHAHADADNLAQAIYGLPEVNAERIARAQLVANPGCYPTAAALGIGPLLVRNLVQGQDIIINAASGITGAGRSPKPKLHFAEANESYAAYNVGMHRHEPEIEQTLTGLKGEPVQVLFAPHLLPIDCGILQTIYMVPMDEQVSTDDVYEAFEDAYADEPFVRVRTTMPNVKHVRATNFCDVAATVVGGRVVLFSAIDNMVKGASGQAMQNMNLMFGLEETAGLL
jgi:N-acetyl-gamma-glutamyl-phosphate reductase